MSLGFSFQAPERLVEYQRSRLVRDDFRNMADSRAREDALGNQELSECGFIDFDGIDIVKMSLFYSINIS